MHSNQNRSRKDLATNQYKEYILALEHASVCLDSTCQIPYCIKIKKLINHQCTSKTKQTNLNKSTCQECAILNKLVQAHVEICKKNDLSCPVHLCSEIKRNAAIEEARAQLKLILHARNCAKRSCLEICRVTKQVIKHAECCERDDGNCNVPFCLNTKQLVQHFDSCIDLNCRICVGFKVMNNENESNNKMESIIFETVQNVN